MDDDTIPSSEETDSPDTDTDSESESPFPDNPLRSPDDSLLEPVTLTLAQTYTYQRDIAGTDVELHVDTVSMSTGRAVEVMDVDRDTALDADHLDGYSLVDVDLFRDAARAVDYEIYANGELIIDGGEDTRVMRLENTICEQVGVARRAKRRMMEAGWDADELDEFSEDAEEFLVDFYSNIRITGAEHIVKGMAFRASGDEELIERTEPAQTAEVRHWVEDSREQLETALDALDDLETMAEGLLGNEYHTATLSTDDDTDAEDIDIEDIRTAMFDSEMPNESFARREKDLGDGRTLEVRPGKYATEVVLEENDGREEVVGATDSLAEAVYMFETYDDTDE